MAFRNWGSSDLDEEVLTIEDTKLNDTDEINHIVVWNDDVNTFDNVIKALVEICKHTPEQAGQCAWLIHTKGKCSVKEGVFKTLQPLAEGLIDRGLNATID